MTNIASMFNCYSAMAQLMCMKERWSKFHTNFSHSTLKERASLKTVENIDTLLIRYGNMHAII